MKAIEYNGGKDNDNTFDYDDDMDENVPENKLP